MQIITDHIERVVAVLLAISAYIAGVRKDKADIFSKMQSAYSKFTDDQNNKYEFMSKQVKILQEQILTFQKNEEGFRATIQRLDTKVNKLEAENKLLRNRLKKYENK
jgi:predicted  nucleic acid-binding Zn-ribbon protein